MAFQDHHNQHHHHQHLSQEIPLVLHHHFSDHHSSAVFRSILPSSPDDKPPPPTTTATWLNTNNTNTSSFSFQWLPQPTQSQQQPPNHSPPTSDHHGPGDDNNSNSNNNNSSSSSNSWVRDKCKADILSHPLFEQLLSAHVTCLRIATPVDQLPRIDAQLAQSHNIVAKYSSLLRHAAPATASQQPPLDDKDLDHFMITTATTCPCPCNGSSYGLLGARAILAKLDRLSSDFHNSITYTRVAPGESTGATMSDDDEDQADSETNLCDESLDGANNMGFGPLVPTESERSLMERVRQELKHELKQGYMEKIVDIREEILRKRRAGKLPGDTTSVLKAWWQSHSKWPYPTEEDKARLVQETGLQLKQINNWFINQRKRNWHSNLSSSSSQKSKRKR